MRYKKLMKSIISSLDWKLLTWEITQKVKNQNKVISSMWISSELNLSG
jgi:hypothetical protein